jgi:hypothetical protein
MRMQGLFTRCAMRMRGPVYSLHRCACRGLYLGDSWVSPMDFVNAWGPMLAAMSLADDASLAELKRLAQATQVGVGCQTHRTGRWTDKQAGRHRVQQRCFANLATSYDEGRLTQL